LRPVRAAVADLVGPGPRACPVSSDRSVILLRVASPIGARRRREEWPLPEAATRVLLATAEENVLPAVAAVARSVGLSVFSAPGLLDLSDEREGVGVELFFDRLSRALTGAEAEAVRVATDPAGEYTALAIGLLTAPTLAQELARRAVTAEVGVLAEAELWSAYQPVVALADRAVVAHEALLRGDSDGRTVDGGDLFFVADSAGWLPRLDRVGRECAIAGAAGWLGGADLFVNTHPTSVLHPDADLASTVEALEVAGLQPRQLVLEVGERAAVADRGHLLAVLESYRARGWRVALDEVAAGWSSRSLLDVVRPDVVKLGRALVSALPDDGARAVVRTVAGHAHRLGAVVVAEGVETEQVAEEVAALGADLAQGWLFGRPAAPAVEPAEVSPAPTP
jgi:EAL domain-containing protein (putative c-di-GMP-specific phosphodiesterase class I)